LVCAFFAQTAGYHTVRLNLRQAEEQFLTDLDAFLRWFCLKKAEGRRKKAFMFRSDGDW
jgi:hypothetical protein